MLAIGAFVNVIPNASGFPLFKLLIGGTDANSVAPTIVNDSSHESCHESQIDRRTMAKQRPKSNVCKQKQCKQKVSNEVDLSSSMGGLQIKLGIIPVHK